MQSLENLRGRAEDIVSREPIWAPAFPPQPWDEADLKEIATTVEAFLIVDSVHDDEPWVDWLDRWKFYQAAK